MIASSLHGNNRLVRKTILRMYPTSFAANLTSNIALMVDTLLAGALLGQEAIAAVAIGMPAIGLFQALTQTATSGAMVKMAVYAGRGDQDGLNRHFSLGVFSAFALGIFFILICMTMADKFVMLFGGGSNPKVAAQAALYLRICSIRILMGSLNMFISKIHALYGYQMVVFRAALIALVGNIASTVLYVNLLPEGYKIMGIAMGAWSGGLCAIISSVLTMKAKKIPLRLRLKDVHLKELPGVMRVGFPTSGNMLADNLVAGIINNLIVAAFGGDTTALSVYTAVKGISSFCDAAEKSISLAISPLLGILYGSRDRNGIHTTVKEGLKLGLIASLIWGGMMFLLLPVWARVYGMAGNPHFRTGVIFALISMPLWLLIHVLTQTFESTEKSGMGLLYASIPDSLIYPIMLALLLPAMKYNGIWVAYRFNAIPFLIILYLIRSIRQKNPRLSLDRLLLLDESIRDHVPMLDISIQANNVDVTGISRQVHEFMLGEKAPVRTAYMTALCLEELAADFVAHTMQEGAKAAERAIMDIKLFSDEDAIQIVIRNAASRYNPLDFDLDDQTFAKVGVKMVQKIARRINYNYVYQMNIVTIDVETN